MLSVSLSSTISTLPEPTQPKKIAQLCVDFFFFNTPPGLFQVTIPKSRLRFQISLDIARLTAI